MLFDSHYAWILIATWNLSWCLSIFTSRPFKEVIRDVTIGLLGALYVILCPTWLEGIPLEVLYHDNNGTEVHIITLERTYIFLRSCNKDFMDFIGY